MLQQKLYEDISYLVHMFVLLLHLKNSDLDTFDYDRKTI